MMKLKWFILIFLGVVTITVCLFVYRENKTVLTESEITIEFLEKRIEKLGPKQAYKEFGQSIAHLTPQEQHSAAHKFGAALYKMASIEGLPICDESFSNGCFHSFSGLAIAEGGFDETLTSMVNKCNKEETIALTHSCLHGVGHGMTAYLGYEDENLSKAIEVCKNKTGGNLTAGCWGGVFMEYNLRTLLGTEALRELNETTIYTPCDSLSEDLKASCMFWQSEWWEANTTNTLSTTEFFKVAGSYCADLTEEAIRQACFAGIGSLMPTRVADIHEGSAVCRQIAKTVQDAIACWSFVYNKTPFSEKSNIARENFCNDYTNEDLQYCLAHKDISADIFNERGQALFP